MKTRTLAEEAAQSFAALPPRCAERLADGYGVPPMLITIAQLIGIKRVKIKGRRLYEPDAAGEPFCITPVLVDSPWTPESRDPAITVRYGALVDLVAWRPDRPSEWALRGGAATWLGAVPPQYCQPDPVPVSHSILGWFQAGAAGIVLLTDDPAERWRILADFRGGIDAEDDRHAAELRRAVARPWPGPRVFSKDGRRAAA
jgi:hypothetical protein